MSMVEPQPLPRVRAFERGAFGLFLHFGLYSRLGRGEWAWTHHRLPRDEYLALQRSFTASRFDARAICAAAKAAGMRYVCLTTRHHEGFSLYDTRGLNDYDALHAPCGRDLVREFSDACEAEGLGKFLYHTTLDWWHPAFDDPARWDEYLAYLNASVEVLCTRYGRVDGFWFDGNWARKGRDWKEDALYAVIRRHQPDAIIVNNSSTGALGAEGHPEVDVRTFEQGRPDAPSRAGKAKYLAGEMCETVGSHWGAALDDLSHKSPAEIIDRLVACRRVGANLLLNIGPDAEGALPDYERALLGVVGRWTAGAAPALYDAVPCPDLRVRGGDAIVRDGATWYYLCRNLTITENAHLQHGEPGDGLKTVEGGLPAVRAVRWLDTGEALRFSQDRAQGMLTFAATRWPYGANRVWRVAVIET